MNDLITEEDLVVFTNILEMVIDTDKEIEEEERELLKELLEKVYDTIERMREEGIEGL